MQILDGRKAREHYVTLLQKRIKELAFTPCLVIIQVGNCTDSDSFINAKKFFAKKIGVKEIHVKCDVNINQNELLYIVEKCNDDKTAQGIIIQLPLPPHLNSEIIINSIDPKKDVDGLTPNTSFIPATARGISQLFDFYNIGLSGKKVTVIGRSKLVGTPIANMCRSKGAIVTVCHSKTEVEDVIKNTKNADILIVAIGKANLIDEKYISKGTSNKFRKEKA